MTESLLLAVLGGLLGWLIAWAGLDGLSAIGIETLPLSGEIWLDGTAMVFTIGVALIVGALMAILPALRLLHVSPTDVLREEGRSGTASRGVRLARQALVVTQIAMALVLLAGAGLLLASFRELLAIDPGFEPRGVLTARVDLPVAVGTRTMPRAGASSSGRSRVFAPCQVSSASGSRTTFHSAVITAARPSSPRATARRPGESVVWPWQ